MKYFFLLFIFSFYSCKTSSDLKASRGLEFGTEKVLQKSREVIVVQDDIQTVENPHLSSSVDLGAQVDPLTVEKLREIDVLKGQIAEKEFSKEELRREYEDKLAQLKAENELLKGGTLQGVAPTVHVQDVFLPSVDVRSVGTPNLLWKNIVNEYRLKKYKLGIDLSQEFLKTYPEDSSQVYVLLGKAFAHYGLKDYKNALLSFNKILDSYPKHPLAALSWFGQGASFHQQGSKKDSQLFFRMAAKEDSKLKDVVERLIKDPSRVPSDLFKAFPKWNTGAPYGV